MIQKGKKRFYTNLITGDILPFTEFINKAAEVGGLARESPGAKGWCVYTAGQEPRCR